MMMMMMISHVPCLSVRDRNRNVTRLTRQTDSMSRRQLMLQTTISEAEERAMHDHPNRTVLSWTRHIINPVSE